jgi:hypothetical protein
MVGVHERLHAVHEISELGRAFLRCVEHALRPLELLVIGDDDHALTAIAACLNTALHEHVDAGAVVRLAPGRVRVEAVEAVRLWKGLAGVVEFGAEVPDLLALCEALDRLDHALVEVEYGDLRRSVIDGAAALEVGDADADGVAVADERESLLVGPVRDQFRLEDHVASLHVDLVNAADRSRPILHDIGDRIYGLLQIYMPPWCCH